MIFISIFVLVFGVVNYTNTSENIFLFFTKIYFIIVFTSIAFLFLFNNIFKKLLEIFYGFWQLFLVLEIIYFIILVCAKLFYKGIASGIYLSDILVFILCGGIVSCHFYWFFLRKLERKGEV
jgi:hypothetical protein